MLDNPIQLIGPASPFGDSRETFRNSGTDGSNPVPSSKESANFQSLEPEAFTDAVFGVPTVNAFRYLHRCL